MLGEPAQQRTAVVGTQNEHVVFVDFVARFDADGGLECADIHRHDRFAHSAAEIAHFLARSRHVRTRIRIVVFDQPGRRIRVELGHPRRIADVDLPALQHHRHGHDQREFLGIALVVAGQRQHRAVAVAHQHHLRAMVEQLRLPAGDIETAKGVRGTKRCAHRQRQAQEPQTPVTHDEPPSACGCQSLARTNRSHGPEARGR